MGYVRANDILPESLLEAIQDYVDGEYIYIPRKDCNKKTWGEIKNSKQEVFARNTEIYEKYQKGISVQKLATTYYLSAKTIYKIIAAIKADY